MSKHYAIFGSPVLHSKSPVMFKDFFETSNSLDCNYIAALADNFSDVKKLSEFLKLDGFNVTAPFKYEMYKLCGHKSPEAELTEAVNMVKVKPDGSFQGENTDYLGLIDLAKKLSARVAHRKILVVGVGSSGRAVALAFKNSGYEVWVANRTTQPALDFTRKYDINFIEIEKVKDTNNEFSLIISTVPHNTLNDLVVGFRGILLDAIYHDRLDPAAHDFTYLPGEEWLIAQAIHNAFKWGYFALENVFRHAAYFASPKRRNIILSGFTGSGKTTVGKALADKLGYKFIDTDEMIEEQTGMSIENIFEQTGEQNFRFLESEALSKIVFSERTVISLGGGTLDNPANYTALKKAGTIIWLAYDTDKLAQRADINRKPMLASRTPEQIRDLIERRSETYFQTADAVIFNDNFDKTVTLLHEEISKALGN